MVNPVTTNIGLIVPLTGSDVDLWGELDINPNMVAIDGQFAGVQTISVSSSPVTLTAPAGLVPTPSAGPTQAQNRVLRFTGTLTADVRITLPVPGSYLIDNRTTGNFVLSFQGVTATEVVGIAQGEVVEIYNDGANVRFVNLGRVAASDFWNGISSIPAWVTACTVKPYLIEDGSTYNFSDYPALSARLLGSFGGNGSTTFAVPDSRARLKLSYDGTGARVTVAGGAGFNGQTMGAAGGAEGVSLTGVQNGPHFHAAGIYDPSHTHGVSSGTTGGTTSYGIQQGGSFSGPVGAAGIVINGAVTGVRVNSPNGIDTTNSSGSATVHQNMPPSIVSGIWVIKT